jgi:hypothetical protein
MTPLFAKTAAAARFLSMHPPEAAGASEERAAIPVRYPVVLICFCVFGLVGEVIARQIAYQQLTTRLSTEQTKARQKQPDSTFFG